MKKLILTFIAAVTTCSLQAQNINPGQGDHAQYDNSVPAVPTHADSLSGWCIDFNTMLGFTSQHFTNSNPGAAYTMPLNANISNLKFSNGMSFGIEAQGGYFFGKKRNWGVGMGLLYIYQSGNVTMDRFHVAYASYDRFGNIFRQEVTANHQIKERIRTSSFNVPIVAKYQTRFAKKVGFTADAGILFNLHVTNHYKTNASFDYEAIYKYVQTENGITTVYDDATPPASTDLLITKSQYLINNPTANVQDYFNAMQAQGYNVGLNKSPNDNRGSMSYMSGSVGFIIRPAISIYLTNELSLNLGAYYYYQAFRNKESSNYHITDKVGEYSSVLNTVTNATTNSYGINVGLRYMFKKRAPKPAAAPAPVQEPETVEVASPVEVDEPEVSDHVDISTPLLFDLNKIIIKESSIPILEEAVRELKANPNASLTIHGYTDNTGAADYNKKLSRKRAAVVKNYLKNQGVDPKILKTVGHGESHPIRSNRTKEGRMRNRRVIMKVKD